MKWLRILLLPFVSAVAQGSTTHPTLWDTHGVCKHCCHTHGAIIALGMHATAIGCQLLHSWAHNQSMCSRERGHQLCSHKGHIRDTWGDRELLAGLSSPALAAPPGPPLARKLGQWDWIPTELGGTASLPGASLPYLRYLLYAVLSRSVVSDSATPRTPARLLCSWGFSRQEYWSRLPCPPPGDLPNPGIEPRSVFDRILYHLSHWKLVLFKRMTGWKRAHVPLVLFPKISSDPSLPETHVKPQTGGLCALGTPIGYWNYFSAGPSCS